MFWAPACCKDGKQYVAIVSGLTLNVFTLP
jgi:hypothetical protein